MFLLFFSRSEKKGDSTELAKAQDSLRRIGRALMSYNTVHKKLPPAIVYGPGGKALYSWRVLLLPFLGQKSLYRRFHLDEPWDSPHNRTLLKQKPMIYNHPARAHLTETHWQVFVGPDSAFAKGPSIALTDINDNPENTILVIETAEGVPWTKPADLAFGDGKPLPSLGVLFPVEPNLFLCLTADGKVHTLDRRKVSNSTLRAAVIVTGDGWAKRRGEKKELSPR
jgi:hypothetical protein